VGERGSYRLERTLESTQVPATVQAVLAARIDRLPPDEKRLLQSAAVIGKDVPLVILQAIADQSEQEISRGLSLLQAAEFLYETSLFPEVEYTFKHALTHEVAYGSILQERRRSVHARIVEVIEQLYSDRLVEQVERLAHHALRGELWEKAIDYLHQAGKKAAARSATREAVTTFEQALDAIRHLPESREATEKAISIRVDLGPLLIAALGYAAPEVEENYSRARELCEQFDATPQLFPVLWALARVHDVKGELNRGREVGEQLLQIAETVRDSGLLLEAHHERWANLTILGELTSAWTHLDQGFSLYDPQKHREHAFLYGGHDPGVCCGFHASHVLWLLGYPDHALRRSREAVALARQLAQASSLHLALSFTAWFYHRLTDGHAIRALVDECTTLVNQQGFTRGRARTAFLQGWLLVEQGQQEAGIAQMSAVLAAERERQGSVAWITQYAAVLAEAYKEAGQLLQGLTVVTDALAMVHQSGARYCEAELHRIRGELLRTQAVASEGKAESCFTQAIDVARSQSAKSWELRAAMSLSSLWQKQGKKDDARRLLVEIYGRFTEGFETADLKTAKALINELT
jgi:predicted ATPase